MGTSTKSLSGLNDFIKFNVISKRNFTPEVYEGYRPEKFQIDIHRSACKYNALLGSPGLGKTILGAQEIIRFIKYKKGNGLIVMPTYGMAYSVALRELRKWAPKNIFIPRSHHNNIIHIGDGRVIFIRSAEHPDKIDGLDRITFAWIDEGDLVPKVAWDYVKERLNRQTGGIEEERRVLVTATPNLVKGESWIKDIFWENYVNGNEDFFCRKATIWESGRYSEADKEKIREENPPGTRSRARYDAEWVTITDGVIYPDLPHIGQHFAHYGINDSDELFFGVDAGFRDPFVMLLVGRKGNIFTVFSEYRAINKAESLMAIEIIEWLTRLGVNKIQGALCFHDHEPNQIANLNYYLLKNHLALSFHPADKGKKKTENGDKDGRSGSITFIKDMMIKELIQIDSGAKETYFELCAYAWKKTGEKQKEPEHKYSHGPDALRYAIYTRCHYTGKSRVLYAS